MPVNQSANSAWKVFTNEKIQLSVVTVKLKFICVFFSPNKCNWSHFFQCQVKAEAFAAL